MKHIKRALFLGLFLLSGTTLLWAEIEDVGNATCPISGDKTSGKFFVEYQGKRYGLCCPMCEKDFNKNPEKFIASLSNSSSESRVGHDH
jgi:YHS domain-containing protein